MRWGIIQDSNAMIIIRIEKKNSLPYIVISPIIPVNSKTGPYPMALMCYMLLSGNAEVNIVHPNIIASVPLPGVHQNRR